MQTEILYEDDCVLVCRKPSGLATQTERLGQMDVVSELKNYLKSPYLAVIHRLDQPVEGVLVFGKTKKAAAHLSGQSARRTMDKRYLALCFGVPAEESGTLVDYLVKDAAGKCSLVVDRESDGARRARLSYRVVQPGVGGAGVSLLEVALRTGRRHQIRVQLSHVGLPILGDVKYGTQQSMAFSEERGIRSVALCAYRLEFVHPRTGERMCFQCDDPASFCRKRGFCLT